MSYLELLKYAVAMTVGLKAVRVFAWELTENSPHSHWKNECWTEYAYSLDVLTEYLDLCGKLLRGNDISWLGRPTTTKHGVGRYMSV